MSGQHLEQTYVVLVELILAELRDDDDSEHTGGVAQRDCDDRLGDSRGSRDLHRILAVESVRDEDTTARQGDPTRDSLSHPALEHVGRLVAVVAELAAERDRHEPVALGQVEAAVVVVDERSKLGHDRLADPGDVVQPAELPDEALEHLQVGDRAGVAPAALGVLRALVGLLSEHHDLALALGLRGHHGRLGARGELARIHRVLRCLCDPGRDRQVPGRIEARLREPLVDPDCERAGVIETGVAHDDAELLAAQPADDVRYPCRLHE